MLEVRSSDIPKEIVNIINDNEREIPYCITVTTVNLHSPKKEPVLMTLNKNQLIKVMEYINAYLLGKRFFAIFKNNFEIEVRYWGYGEFEDRNIFKPKDFMVRDFEIIGIQDNDPQVRNVETLNYRIIEIMDGVLRIIKHLLERFNIRCNEQFLYELPDLSKWGDWND